MSDLSLEQRVARLERLVEELLRRKNPWSEMAGIWKDDPTIHEFQAAIAEHRREVDSRPLEEDSL